MVKIAMEPDTASFFSFPEIKKVWVVECKCPGTVFFRKVLSCQERGQKIDALRGCQIPGFPLIYMIGPYNAWITFDERKVPLFGMIEVKCFLPFLAKQERVAVFNIHKRERNHPLFRFGFLDDFDFLGRFYFLNPFALFDGVRWDTSPLLNVKGQQENIYAQRNRKQDGK
jgi:hypothetical protein